MSISALSVAADVCLQSCVRLFAHVASIWKCCRCEILKVDPRGDSITCPVARFPGLSYQSIDTVLPVVLQGRCSGWSGRNHHGGILMGMQIAYGLATSADIDPLRTSTAVTDGLSPLNESSLEWFCLYVLAPKALQWVWNTFGLGVGRCFVSNTIRSKEISQVGHDGGETNETLTFMVHLLVVRMLHYGKCSHFITD